MATTCGGGDDGVRFGFGNDEGDFDVVELIAVHLILSQDKLADQVVGEDKTEVIVWYIAVMVARWWYALLGVNTTKKVHPVL